MSVPRQEPARILYRVAIGLAFTVSADVGCTVLVVVKYLGLALDHNWFLREIPILQVVRHEYFIPVFGPVHSIYHHGNIWENRVRCGFF